jgi:hypothetical protein
MIRSRQFQIADENPTIPGNQDVSWLQVSMDVAFRVTKTHFQESW